MRLGDPKKNNEDIIFTIQKSGVGGTGKPGDPWTTLTGPGQTTTTTTDTGGTGQGTGDFGTGLIKAQTEGDLFAVLTVNGEERWRSSVGGEFSTRIEQGDEIGFSAEGTDTSRVVNWSMEVMPDSSSSSSSNFPTSTPAPTSTSTPAPTSTSTPAPTSTSTPVLTPTPTSGYDTTITVFSGSSYANGLGVTLVSSVGTSLSYNTLENFSGTPFNIKVYIDSVQIALLTVTTPYVGLGFKISTTSGGVYFGTFESDGRVDFSSDSTTSTPTATPTPTETTPPTQTPTATASVTPTPTISDDGGWLPDEMSFLSDIFSLSRRTCKFIPGCRNEQAASYNPNCFSTQEECECADGRCSSSSSSLATSTPTPTSTSTPTPTSTSTPTPTSTSTPSPTSEYNTTITVPSDQNYINGQGVTLASSVGTSISYNTLENFSGTPINIKVYVSGVQIALITVTTPYVGLNFIIQFNGQQYTGIFEIDGRVDF